MEAAHTHYGESGLGFRPPLNRVVSKNEHLKCRCFVERSSSAQPHRE
jgi:hypothetical protein